MRVLIIFSLVVLLASFRHRIPANDCFGQFPGAGIWRLKAPPPEDRAFRPAREGRYLNGSIHWVTTGDKYKVSYVDTLGDEVAVIDFTEVNVRNDKEAILTGVALSGNSLYGDAVRTGIIDSTWNGITLYEPAWRSDVGVLRRSSYVCFPTAKAVLYIDFYLRRPLVDTQAYLAQRRLFLDNYTRFLSSCTQKR